MNKPAFPTTYLHSEHEGMTMRQAYKMAALGKMNMSIHEVEEDDFYPKITEICGKMADAMLKEDEEHERD